MSMYRQMWLAIILSTAIAMLGGLLASTLNARTYLSEQLSAKNIDNATALALALSQQNADVVMLELTVAAQFDSGHYELIRIIDPLGKVMIERSAPRNTPDVPEWFVRALPLSAATGKAQISNGWNQTGTLTLVSDSRFAYEALWKSVVQLFMALGLAGLVGGCLGALTLRRLREPLQRVIDQANAISDRRFVLIEAPDVPELKQLALAMNSAVTHLKSVFAEESQRLELLRITANYDPLTGLANRTFFLVQLLDMVDTNKAAGGTLILLRLADLPGTIERIGQPATDELLKLAAERLRQVALQTQGVPARLGEAEFVLMLPREVNGQKSAADLLNSLIEAGKPLMGGTPMAHIGIARLREGQDIAGLLAEASQALGVAEAQGVDAIREASGSEGVDLASAENETGRLVSHALDSGNFRLAPRAVFDLQGKLVHEECPLELMLDGTDSWQEINHFSHIAEMFQLSPLLDLTALRLGLEKLTNEPELPGVSIGLSAYSLREDNFRQRVLELMASHAQSAKRLWLEVPEADVLKHALVLPAFIADVQKTGSRVGLTQFGRHFSHSDSLHDLGLDFLKVDSSFIRGLQYNKENQTFLKTLATAAHLMRITIYAEGVIDRAELTALKDTGFDGATGIAVKNT